MLWFSATSPITGNNLELFRFDALIHPEAAADSPTGTSDPNLNASSFSSDPSLIVLAYSADTTGNGTLSSLDASRIQQQVVGHPVDSFPAIG
ncbi:MAG: hypothetical protein VKJ87_00975 [Synechococcus sp.]|nr:hypothetical protein [Synechococcus sp.]